MFNDFEAEILIDQLLWAQANGNVNINPEKLSRLYWQDKLQSEDKEES